MPSSLKTKPRGKGKVSEKTPSAETPWLGGWASEKSVHVGSKPVSARSTPSKKSSPSKKKQHWKGYSNPKLSVSPALGCAKKENGQAPQANGHSKPQGTSHGLHMPAAMVAGLVGVAAPSSSVTKTTSVTDSNFQPPSIQIYMTQFPDEDETKVHNAVRDAGHQGKIPNPTPHAPARASQGPNLAPEVDASDTRSTSATVDVTSKTTLDDVLLFLSEIDARLQIVERSCFAVVQMEAKRLRRGNTCLCKPPQQNAERPERVVIDEGHEASPPVSPASLSRDQGEEIKLVEYGEEMGFGNARQPASSQCDALFPAASGVLESVESMQTMAQVARNALLSSRILSV